MGIAVKSAPHCGRIHESFWEAYASLRERFFQRLAKSIAKYTFFESCPKICAYVVGHGLGGALATLTAYEIATLYRYDVRCITFGCPRIGDAEFAKAYAAAVPSTIRFVNKADSLPRTPVNPADPYDDAEALGRKWLLDGSSTVYEAAEYVHVCRGTVLGQDISSANCARESIKAVFDDKKRTLFSHLFFEAHTLSSYSNNLNDLIERGAVDAGCSSASCSTTTAVQKPQQGIGGLLGGLT